MRYLNWDVLLFPNQSRIPIQEFDTKCHALTVSDNWQANRYLPHPAPRQIPNIAGFVCSLPPGSPFRVSIHSWEKPVPSDIAVGVTTLQNPTASVGYEATLYIDGQIRSQRHIGEGSVWPEVIAATGGPHESDGCSLLFPKFHAEILQQSHWDAGDGLGRIRVVLSEGTFQNNVGGTGRVFEKIQDILAFSFQHAPKNILEHSGIAWPNDKMLQKAKPAMRPRGSVSNGEAHAHSPQRSRRQPSRSSLWLDTTPDPFYMGAVGPRNHKQTATDTSMADAPSLRTGSEMSGIVTDQPTFRQQVNHAAVEEIIRALTPAKKDALLLALSPLDFFGSSSTAVDHSTMVKTLPDGRIQSVTAFEPALRSRSTTEERISLGDSTSLSSRSASGYSTSDQSARLSGSETLTLPEVWSRSTTVEYPGMLPRISNVPARGRSTSVASKRKRGSSPLSLEPRHGNAMKGMSTSPCKSPPTPSKKPAGKAKKRESSRKRTETAEKLTE